MSLRTYRTLGILGDVHQQDTPLETALRHFSTLAVDGVVCVGDLADGRGSLERCCALLQAHQVQVVRGNHDRWLLRGSLRDLPEAFPTANLGYPERDYLRTLPALRELNTPCGDLLLCHGMAEDDLSGLYPWDEGYALQTNSELQRILALRRWRIVVAGHTHQRLLRQLQGVWFLNPGTLLSCEEPPTVAVADFNDRVARFYHLPSTGGVREVESFPLVSP